MNAELKDRLRVLFAREFTDEEFAPMGAFLSALETCDLNLAIQLRQILRADERQSPHRSSRRIARGTVREDRRRVGIDRGVNDDSKTTLLDRRRFTDSAAGEEHCIAPDEFRRDRKHRRVTQSDKLERQLGQDALVCLRGACSR